MKYEDVRRYAELMKEFGLTSLELSDEGTSLKLETGAKTAALQPAVPASADMTAASAEADGPAVSGASADEAAAGTAADSSSISIKSPMVGVFYRSPAENAAPYVKVGDTVRKGTVIGLIEAMKLMNEIVSDSEGVVESIFAENGQTVDYGFELIRLKKI